MTDLCDKQISSLFNLVNPCKGKINMKWGVPSWNDQGKGTDLYI